MELTVQEHNKRVVENDALIAGRIAELRDKNAGWLGRKLRKSADAPRHNRSGHGPEHTEALIENSHHDALIENASRSPATEIDKALNG